MLPLPRLGLVGGGRVCPNHLPCPPSQSRARGCLAHSPSSNAVPPWPYCPQEVCLVKAGGPLGLSIVGGSDHSSHPFGIQEPGVFISKVAPWGVRLCRVCPYHSTRRAEWSSHSLLEGGGELCTTGCGALPWEESPVRVWLSLQVIPRGLACRSGLRVGDRILDVNGIDLHHATHQEAVSALLSNTHELRMMVRRDPPPPGMEVGSRGVTLLRPGLTHCGWGGSGGKPSPLLDLPWPLVVG